MKISIFNEQTMTLNVGIPNGKLINISKSLSSNDVHHHVQTYDIYGHLRDNSHEFFSFISRVGKPLTLNRIKDKLLHKILMAHRITQ